MMSEEISDRRPPVIGSALPSWPATGLRYPRTVAEAFPDVRASAVSGPYRSRDRVRYAVAVAVLAVIARWWLA